MGYSVHEPPHSRAAGSPELLAACPRPQRSVTPFPLVERRPQMHHASLVDGSPES